MAIAPEAPKENEPKPKEEAPPAPPPTPPAETADQRATRLEKELKDRDSKISDLSTTIATIEQRTRELETASAPKGDELEKELSEIEELRITDPGGAAKRTAELFRKVSTTATQRAQGVIAQQTTIDRLRTGVKSSNSDFDDDVVDYVMERADMLAKTGKFKTAEEAVNAAVTLVKSKFDGYAQKKNAAPPLPAAAQVETGGNTPPAPAPKDTPLPTPSEELGQRREAMQKKII